MQREQDTLKSKIIAVLVIAVAIAFLVNLNKSKELEEKKLELAERQESVEIVMKNNKEVLKKQRVQDEKMGFNDVKEKTDEFYNYFFNWSSWQTYSDNMLEIQKRFPKLNEYSPVDISGAQVGTGQSPISSISGREYFTTKDKNKIITFVNQIRNTSTTSVTTNWRAVTRLDEDGFFRLDEMGSYVQ